MAEYDRNLARAWEIVRKQSELDSQEVELHSGGDLSELASSIFNGMEGIEMDVPTEGDVDKQAGQETEGLEAGSDSGVLGDKGNNEVALPVFSPKKTRSGPVR